MLSDDLIDGHLIVVLPPAGMMYCVGLVENRIVGTRWREINFKLMRNGITQGIDMIFAYEEFIR